MNNKKKTIIIVFLLIIISAAIGLYFYLKNKQKEKTTNTAIEQTPTETSTTAKAKIIIKTNPTNARVTVSGINSSFFEERVGSFEINVPVEKIYITAFLPYYQNSSQEIELKEGEIKNIEFNLEHISRDITEGAPVEGLGDGNDPNNLIPNP